MSSAQQSWIPLRGERLLLAVHMATDSFREQGRRVVDCKHLVHYWLQYMLIRYYELHPGVGCAPNTAPLYQGMSVRVLQ